MQLWTYLHAITLLPSLAVMLVTAVVLRIAIGNKPLKTRMIPFQILACIAFALEVGKQVISFCRGYDLYHIPLHFCSLFIFALPVMAFYQGKHRQTVTAVTTALCSALFSLMLIYPNIIYGEGSIRSFFTDYMSFHTVAFHNLVMLEFLLILFLNLHTPNIKKDAKYIILFTVCFCIAAASMSQIIKTNFANFYQCNVPVLESVRQNMQKSLGYVVTQLIYVSINSALHIVFVFVFYCLYSLFAKRIKGINIDE